MIWAYIIKCALNYINNESEVILTLFMKLSINILIQATDQGNYKT